MADNIIDTKKIVLMYLDLSQIQYLSTRSQGAGGQHVNKTNSCIQLRFSIGASPFPDEIKNKFYRKLANKIIQDDIIQIRVETERDQKMNKDMALKKLIEMLAIALIEPKKRVKTKPTRSSIGRRLDSKKNRSDIKKNRSNKKWD
jgi:ribosome-associated protein